MLEKGVYFVTGIDTDAGKSYVVGYLARQIMNARGVDAIITQKLVQTGCQGVSEDIITHRRLMGIPLQAVDLDFTTCPLVYSYPCSPDVAARMDGRTVDLELAARSTAALRAQYDTVIIEGAGGLMVPLTDDMLTADYVARHKLPIILVTSARLGSINHTLLTLEVCRNRGLQVAALVYNAYPETAPEIEQNTRAFLQLYLERYHAGVQWIEVPLF